MARAIFVYGTLKRGGSNHRYLDGQRFIDSARTVPGFTLYQVEDYPAMVADVADRAGVTGETWEVDAACLARLDALEGIDQALFARVKIPLAPPFNSAIVEGYLFVRTVAGLPPVGSTWQP